MEDVQSYPKVTRLEEDREKIPRIMILAVGLLLLACLALVSYARLTDRPLVAKPEEGAIAQERILHLYSQFSGAVRILDGSGSLIADLGPNEGGFISGVGRALARERAKSGIPADAPVRLVQYSDGRMALHDDLSGWRVELLGFGRKNAAAFAALLSN
ncbi:MAG: photosynthetic complex assembly protein PuhC [Pseudomonadota bacterium]